jgi:hypothetical protein
MKKIVYLSIVLFFTLSCKDKSERLYESISGTWKLETMQYTDSTGITKSINNSEIILIFDYIDRYSSHQGFQVIKNDTMEFEYFIDSNSGDLDFKESDIMIMPLDAIGRMQVYNFNKIDRNTIEFYTDFEFDYLNNQKLYNTSYLYSKID